MKTEASEGTSRCGADPGLHHGEPLDLVVVGAGPAARWSAGCRGPGTARPGRCPRRRRRARPGPARGAATGPSTRPRCAARDRRRGGSRAAGAPPPAVPQRTSSVPSSVNSPRSVASTSRSRASSRKAGELRRRDRQRHPLLRLGDQHLPRRQPLVLERRAREVEPGAARLPGHLADRGGEAAGAVVGDRRVEPGLARLEQEVEHHLLGDGVADLDRLHRALLVELRRGEGGAVDAVLADAAADHDDAVAGPGRLHLGRRGRRLVTGMRPTVPQKTSGLPRKRSSKNSQPRP